MKTLTLLSWNVNGIRAVEKRGFCSWLEQRAPAVLAVQETKAHPEQLSAALRTPPGYQTYWTTPVKKGYSGVGVFSRAVPCAVEQGFGVRRFDDEGRVLMLEYDSFILFNIYFPNGKSGPERLDYKIDFYRQFFASVARVRHKGKTIVVCGDFNTAHTEIDLARPKENAAVSGFLPQERELLDLFIASGYTDAFRVFNPSAGGQYTWWDVKTRARERNVGWRIDYFFIDTASVPRLKNAFIAAEVTGSDHCPVGIEITA